MASFTAAQLGPRFGIGTSVSAYLRSQWPNNQLIGAPSGAAVAGPVAVASDGSATFTGLTPETEYIIYAGAPDRYTSFVVGTGGVSTAAKDVEVIGQTALSDAAANPNAALFGALLQMFNGATWDRARIATVFKSFASTAITAGTGATIWTPTAGKKFRVLGLGISSSVAGQLILGDNLVGTVIARSPALAAAGIWQIGVGDLLNGILSAAINNVLKLDGPTGNVAGMVWGTEE